MLILIPTLFFAAVFFAYIWNKFSAMKVCPVCIGVSITWLGLSVGVVAGYLAVSQYSEIIALLMGGSVVGIAYQGEKKLNFAAKHSFLWKLAILVLGMPLAYEAITHLNVKVITSELIILIIIAYFFFIRRIGPNGKRQDAHSKRIRRIEEQMEQCC